MCDFGWSWKTEVMGGFDLCDAKMLREGCFKKYIQAPLIGMRIWFGLILKIMVRLCICQLKMLKNRFYGSHPLSLSGF